MITSILVKNFIIFDCLEIALSAGFNVFTGETGAGKSIIVNAINLAFGGKAGKDYIKTGCDKSFIELTFVLGDDFDKSFFSGNGIELDGSEIVVSREITPSASRMRINGSIVTQDFMRTLRESVLDIHSQHETYAFTQPRRHIALLDGFGDALHKKLMDGYLAAYREYRDWEKQLESALHVRDANASRIDFLKFQISEIEAASIESTDEDELLKQELSLLLNAEKLESLTVSAYAGLSSEESCAASYIASALKDINQAAVLDPTLEPCINELSSALAIVRELSSSLRNYFENIAGDEQRLYFVEKRLDVLEGLKRKYGKTLDAVQESLDLFKKELGEIELSVESIESLRNELSLSLAVLEKRSAELTDSRNKLALTLSGLVTEELQKLELLKARFSVDISPQKMSEKGADKVEFLIATNVSESLKPLAKVASGGEMSRVMLALKTIFANNDEINTVIFDEIDSGISGKASQAVAEAFRNLAESHQILAVTHQPIIAAQADKYFYVSKQQDDTTKVSVSELCGDEKIAALAVMAAGAVSQDSLNFAKDLIK